MASISDTEVVLINGTDRRLCFIFPAMAQRPNVMGPRKTSLLSPILMGLRGSGEQCEQSSGRKCILEHFGIPETAFDDIGFRVFVA